MAFTMSYRDPDAAKPAKQARAAVVAKAPRPSRSRQQDKAQAQAEAVFQPPAQTAAALGHDVPKDSHDGELELPVAEVTPRGQE